MFNPRHSKAFIQKQVDFNNKNLKEEDREFLITLAQDQLNEIFNLGFENKKDRDDKILQGRFKKGLKCPKCGNMELNKNGKTNGRQRYICKNCRTTFDERSFSPLSNTKLSLEKWQKYCRLMLQGGTIKYCAQKISVSIPTSFFMRHRILDVINLSLKNEVLDGIVEADVCYINESFKGAHIKNDVFLEEKFLKSNTRSQKYINEKYFSDFNRDSLVSSSFCFNTTLGTAKNRTKNIKQNQICISTASDRSGHIITRVIDNDLGITNNKIKPQNMLSFFDGKLGSDVILCAYEAFLYRQTAAKLGVKVRQAPRPKSSFYSINHVYEYNWELKRWLKNFNGVATKYLNNYLAWFKFLFLSKIYKEFARVRDLFMNLATEDLCITKEMIKNRYVELL